MSKPLIPLSKPWQRAWAFGQHIVGGDTERMIGIPCVNILTHWSRRALSEQRTNPAQDAPKGSWWLDRLAIPTEIAS
jgi:hypothetical protein